MKGGHWLVEYFDQCKLPLSTQIGAVKSTLSNFKTRFYTRKSTIIC